MISDLNAIPPDVLDEARRLGAEAGQRFLWERVTPPSRPYLPPFVRDVVMGGADPASWSRTKILVPDLALEDLLARSAREVMRPLGRPGDEGWLQLTPDSSADPADGHVGAPAVLRRDLHYLWRAPTGVAVHQLSLLPKLRPLPRVVVGVRRWMAYRAALAAGFQWERLTDATATAALLDLGRDALSPDGIQALEALAMEARADLAGDTPPGFRGADSLYE